MARPSLPDFDGPHPQYNSILFSPANSPMGQIQAVQPQSTLATTQAGRIGDATKKTLRQSKTSSVQVTLWEDEDLSEIDIAMGGDGTVNSGDTVKLNVDASPQTFYIKNYDGISAGANLLSTIYLYNAVPTSFTAGARQVDGQNVVDVQMALEDLYYIKA